MSIKNDALNLLDYLRLNQMIDNKQRNLLRKAILGNMPENPTNGDMIKALFPYIEPKFYTNLSDMHTVDIEIDDKTYGDMCSSVHTFSAEWWNTPYKKETGDE